MITNLQKEKYKQFIFQKDGVNDSLATIALLGSLDAVELFDTSGGAGRTPSMWPVPSGPVRMGYAGGLGPDSIKENLSAIERVCPPDYRTWVDMERNVRTEDDSALDYSKVEKVARLTGNYRKQANGAG